MNNYTKNITNEDGTEETIIISSNDTHTLDLSKTYVLANNTQKKQNKLMKKFKSSVLGADIGIKSGGFSNIAILATIIAVAAMLVLYLLWRF